VTGAFGGSGERQVRAALAVLVGALAIIADVAYRCADRLRSGGRADDDIQDWEFGTYLGVAVGLAGAGWAAAAAVPAGRPIGRLTRPIARYGAGAAAVCGLAAATLAAGGALAAGEGLADFWEHRYELECFLLFGAALGGLGGSAVGAGLGLAAYGSRRPAGPPPDPERVNYADGPGGAPPNHVRAPDRGGGE
jgi:hypothetical protein